MAGLGDVQGDPQPEAPQPAAAAKPGGYEQVLKDLGLLPTQVHAVLEKVSSAKQLIEELVAAKREHAVVQEWFAGSAGQTGCVVPDFVVRCMQQPSSCKKCKEALEAFNTAAAGERKALVPDLQKQYQQAYEQRVKQLIGVGDAPTMLFTSLKLVCEFMEVSQLWSQVSSTSKTIGNLKKRLQRFRTRYVNRILAFLESNAQDTQELPLAAPPFLQDLQDAQEDLGLLRSEIDQAMEDVRNTGSRGLSMMLSSAVEAVGLLVGLRRGPREVLSDTDRAFAIARAGAHSFVAAASCRVVICSTLHAAELTALMADCDECKNTLEDAKRELSRRARTQ